MKSSKIYLQMNDDACPIIKEDKFGKFVTSRDLVNYFTVDDRYDELLELGNGIIDEFVSPENIDFEEIAPMLKKLLKAFHKCVDSKATEYLCKSLLEQIKELEY